MPKNASRDIDRAHDRSSTDMASLRDVLFILGSDIEVVSRVERELQEASESVPAGVFACQVCKKEYKRKGSLTQHIKKIHAANETTEAFETDFLSNETMCELLNNIKSNICESGCFSREIKLELARFTHLQANPDLLQEFTEIYRAYSKTSDKEKFYSSFYSKIVSNAEKYFPRLGRRSGTLLSSKLADHILALKNKKVDAQSAPLVPAQLSQSERDGLHYIGGYIFHKLHRKLKNSTHWMTEESQHSMALLQAGKLASEETAEGNLVAALNRVDLRSVKPCVEEILLVAETNFRHFAQIDTHQIDTTTIITKTVTDDKVLMNFNTLLNDCDLTVEEELSKCILHNIISLYIQVRAFSSARDIVQKHKLKHASKKKGLRGELKRSSDTVNRTDA